MKPFEERVEEHWAYIRSLLEAHGESPNIIEKIGFHYRTAMLHGFGHGYEEGKKDNG